MSRRKVIYCTDERYLRYPYYGGEDCLCSGLRYLTILILIILQFGREDNCREKDDPFDNSILFIIALYFLTCGIRC